MANLLRFIFFAVVAYGAVVDEEMNALLDDSCEGECSLFKGSEVEEAVCNKWAECPKGAKYYRGQQCNAEGKICESYSSKCSNGGLLRHVWQPSLDEPMAIGDFGAGGGHYSKWLNETGLVEAYAFDGTHQAAELTDGLVQEVNLVEDMSLWRRFDWILCLEVGEHVPKQYAPTLMANLKRHASKGLVMSWSDDWEGIGHVNCLSRKDFVAFVQKSTGFVLDEAATEVVREGCEIDYIARTLAVFRAPS